METDGYRAFTRRLVERVARDDRVLGLVALGSMAERDYAPDEWSDHDFFLIVRGGAQEAFRTGPSWLPEAEEVAFWFRETEHGVKVVYRSGHLLEFAVFDERELYLARVNRYRVLVDHGGIEAHMRAVVEATLAVGRRELPTD